MKPIAADVPATGASIPLRGAAFGDWVPIGSGRGHLFMRKWGARHLHRPLLRSAAGGGALIAGILEMPYRTFQIANFTSAFVWAWALLVFGDFGFAIVTWLMGDPI
ncbi:hypothetical protein MAXJ12_34099 [Mesorhizobium alhagi CCNWXJ12-2]|uniref:Uncharacterized protein n=1 Tax=Mesorhizobium alhagi CCNWXJ12-2 TaxID=1107882 RepID=H0I2W4_9HYPH|nr:hypothetical protein MAXJ12_34099 [Mesorhizobium alhagi CCNWXJ12-2]